MNDIDITNFKNSIAKYSLAQLEQLAYDLQQNIGKMVLDMDIVAKAAIVDSLIREKKEDK